MHDRRQASVCPQDGLTAFGAILKGPQSAAQIEPPWSHQGNYAVYSILRAT